MQSLSHFFFVKDEEIVKAKTEEVNSIIERHPISAFSSISLHFPILNYESTDYSKVLDYDVLTPEAEEILRFPFKTQEEWLDIFKKKCQKIEAFFKDTLENDLESEDPRIIKQIIFTIDYKTNLLTFILYLLWKWIVNENEQDMGKFVTTETIVSQFFALLIEFRLNEFQNYSQLILFIQQTIQILPKQSFEKVQRSIPIGISQNQKPFPIIQYNQVLPWNAEEVANMLSFINQSFYVELKIHNIIAKGGLKYYFRRINTLSQYIIYSVIKYRDKHLRQYALAYWIDIAEKLQQNNDLEGLFIVYQYGIQLLLKDYINNTPLLFREINRIPKIRSFYQQEIKHNCEKMANSSNYNIPSFNKYATLIRRLEQQAKQNSVAFEQIAQILETLMKISKEQYNTQQNMKQQLNFRELQILRFVTEGIQMKLESELKIPLEKETLVYIELIKLSKL